MLNIEKKEESAKNKHGKTFEMLPQEKILDNENGLINFQNYVIEKFKSLKSNILPAKMLGVGVKNFYEIQHQPLEISRKTTEVEEEKIPSVPVRRKSDILPSPSEKLTEKRSKNLKDYDITQYLTISKNPILKK